MGSQLLTVSLTQDVLKRFTDLVPNGKRSEVVLKLIKDYCDENEGAIRTLELRGKYLDQVAYPAVKKLLGRTDPWAIKADKIVELLGTENIIVSVKESESLLNKLMNETIDGV
jgi:hypothetical protein